MANAVRDIILTPMQETYLRPAHLRHNAQARSRTLALYEQALAPFDDDTLRRAWQKIVAEHTSWRTWPSPGMIARACRQCQPRPIPPATDEQRKAKAFALADDYATAFMHTSHLAKLAKREGWSGRLREYVTDAAWVQAQMICGVRNIGWNPRLAEGLGSLSIPPQRRLPPTARPSRSTSTKARLV